MAETTTSESALGAVEPAKPSGVEALFPEGKAASAAAETAKPESPKPEGGEVKPAETKPTDLPTVEGKETALGKEPPPEAVKPEDYKFELPEDVQIDEERLGEIRSLFSSLNDGKGIDPKDAQAIVKAHVDAIKKADEAYTKAFNDQRETWRQEILADKDMGGEKLEKEIIPAINRAWQQVLSATEIKELKTRLLATGMDNNPMLVKSLWKLSQPFVEGKGVSGGKPTMGREPAPALLFPNNVPNSGA